MKRNKLTLDFEYTVLSYNLKLKFTQPNRYNSGTCIDNIAHNVRGCKGEIIEFGLSDHTAQLLKCPVNKTCALKYWRIKRQNYCEQNIKKFKNCIKNLSFSEIYETNDVNESYNHFLDLFQCFYNLCFHYELIKKRLQRNQNGFQTE